jgi:hypothetical protein
MRMLSRLVLALSLCPGPTIAAEGRCALLSEQEAAAVLGQPVKPGVIAGPLGTACQWDARKDDDAWVQVQVIDDPGYWSKPSLAPGFQRVPGIGREAYVVPEFGGWAAGALLEARLAVVSVAGGSSTRDRAVGLLQTVVSRLQ